MAYPQPDYMGVWTQTYKDVGIVEESPFFLFIEEQSSLPGDFMNISGSINDKYGKGEFRGTISSSRIVFTKWYSNPTGSAARAEILYAGQKDGDLFKGRFAFEEEGRPFEGGFFLEKCSPSPTLEAIAKRGLHK